MHTFTPWETCSLPRLTLIPLLLAISAMSSSPQASSSSTTNFQPIFEKALQEYKKKTGKDLADHPLSTEINGCNSPDAILAVLEGKANELKQFRSDDERLTKWLNPTVNILNALSATLGVGVSSESYKNQAASLPVFALTLTFRYSPPPQSSFLESVFSSS
jgi:hypothetical protein